MIRRSLFLFLFLFSSSLANAQTKPAIIHIDGESSMKDCTQRLSEWYQHNNPAISFEIGASGSGKAFQSLVDGKADIVQSSREALGGEITALREKRGKKFVQIPVATEVVGIFVNASNPVHELSLFDLRQVLSGAVKNWKQVGGKDAPIKLYGRDDSSDIRQFIEDEFMGDAGIASSVSTFAKNSSLYAAVGKDENAIGYGAVNLGLNSNVKFIAIKASASGPAVAPTTDTIGMHKYPLMRRLYYIFAGEPSGELKRYMEWVLTRQGQLVVEAVELWPLGSTDRENGLTLLSGH